MLKPGARVQYMHPNLKQVYWGTVISHHSASRTELAKSAVCISVTDGVSIGKMYLKYSDIIIEDPNTILKDII